MENIKKHVFNKDFTLMVIGQIISLFGNAILRFALPLYILDMSKSPALFGIVSASSFLPMIIMAPIGGIIADRVNKQKVMVVLDFITGGLIVLFMVLNNFISLIPLVIVVLMTLYSIQGIYGPSVQASIPALLEKDQLVSGNAVVNLVTSMSNLLGPIIGGILFAVYGLTPILIVSSICFVCSAILELFINIPIVKQSKKGSIVAIVKEDMKLSINFIRKDKPILAKVMIIIFLFNLFLSSTILIGMPVIITQTLGLSSKLYGLAQGFLAAGGLIGGILAGVFGRKLNIKKSYILLVFCALSVLPMGLFLWLNLSRMISFTIIVLMSFMAMLFSNLLVIQLMAFVQKETPIQITGKVISLLVAVSISAQPIGQALYGYLFEAFVGKQWVILMISGLIAVVISLYSRFIFHKIETQ